MAPLESLTRAVARQLGEGPGPERRARQRLAVARIGRAAPRSGRWRWAVPIAAAALLLFAWIFVPPAARAPTLIARVGEQSVMAGAWLAARGDEPLAVVFSDRSRVDLAAGAEARLAQLDAARVQIDLERGKLTVAPIVGPGRAWEVVAGPYVVEISGARVEVAWDPQGHTLAVEVQDGSVLVRGGEIASEGARIGAGQRFAVGDEVGDEMAARAEAPPVRDECVGDACATRPARARPEVRRSESWTALADAGEHAAALAEAERQGYAALLERLDAEQLDRLAHSARLAGAGVRAREALLALRRRFPRSSRAGTAAFVLARISVDLERDPAAAIAWFQRYLAENPAGPLAEEARGRLLRALHDEGEVSRARAAADDYLRHHPDGSHASLARKILEN